MNALKSNLTGLLFAAALIWVAGCADDLDELQAACELAAESTPSCTLGTGTAVFAVLSDGDDIEIDQGVQGGFHIWGSFRVTGVNPGNFDDLAHPDNPQIIFSVRTTDGEVLSMPTVLQRGLKVRRDGQIELVGEVVQLDITSVDEASFLDVIFRVEIVDACGTTVVDEINLRLVPDA